MGQKSNEERDYDMYKVKVNRYDKDGNDISQYKLSGGGRRRDDGTIAAAAYDFEELDSTDDSSGMSRAETENELLRYAYEEKLEEARHTHDEEMARLQIEQSMFDLANNILPLVKVYFEEHPEAVVNIAESGKKAVNTIKKQTNKVISSIKGIDKKRQKKPASKLQTVQNSAVRESKEIHSSDTTYDHGIEMTLEQAQAEYIEFFKDFLRMRQRAERLKNARIVDADVQKFDLDQNLALMNSLVEKFPALLDDKIQFQVIEMLKANNNTADNYDILSVLGIETNKGTSEAPRHRGSK